MVGNDSRNKNTLDNKFLCPVCSFILREPVQLNACGHRICHSCLQTDNNTSIKCTQCQAETPVDQIMVDRGFQNDMHSLPIICSYCDWTDILKHYQTHLDQVHPNPLCTYCHAQFTSIYQLNQHQASECQKITVNCLLKEFGCEQPIVRCELSDHYQSQQHQQSILNIIEQMKSQLTDVQIDTDHQHATTTSTEGTFGVNQLRELDETINILANGAGTLNEDAQELNHGLPQHERQLQRLIETMSEVKIAVEEEQALLDRMTQNLELLRRELMSLQENTEEMQIASYDATLTWRITKVVEKIRDAQSERQTSIYSPPFYSSAVGYKMRARLYLNGDGNARRTHMSMFFILMRGPHDAILKFPFNHKVTFCLYDQTSQRRHIIDSFRPDIRSSSFQRPQSEMNIARGIPKFFPLAMIQQEGNPYVRDDTMFIKVMVDFSDIPKTLLPFALSLNPGLPMGIQQAMIKQEAERRAQQQQSQQTSTSIEDRPVTMTLPEISEIRVALLNETNVGAESHDSTNNNDD